MNKSSIVYTWGGGGGIVVGRKGSLKTRKGATSELKNNKGAYGGGLLSS